MEAVDIDIRQAVPADEQWVTNLMERVLAPYYDGDHRAHAKRIFDAHISGGQDKIGFFSYEQRMFIAAAGVSSIGVIHLVGKRQQTYKISPLIVDESFRGSHGIGRRLLAHAESYAMAAGARQLYCTVAEGNHPAMQFFLRHGFIVAGSSDSHYKSGSREVMLYKPLLSAETMQQRDRASISVLPVREEDVEQVREMLLRELPTSFSGIDDAWVDALFAGYSRRHASDINAKYKLVFVASDSSGDILGIAAATPKKGTPIKLMPFIAQTQTAFDALLNDLPFQLAPYGHKLYVHICPTVPQVLSLQRLGWRLDAALPGAYHPDVVTQQWSLDIGKDTMRTMRVKKHFLDYVKSGAKSLEVRVGYDSIMGIAVGERIRLMTHDESLVVHVVDKRTYATFPEMLLREPFKEIVPDAVSSDDVLGILRGFYSQEKESLGVVVLKFQSE